MTKRKQKTVQQRRDRRKRRVRSAIRGTSIRPRLSISRSNRHIYAQLIDDVKGVTLCAASDALLASEEKEDKTKSQVAEQVGLVLAERAEKEGIEEAVFDRGAYRYHGRVKALAEGARQGGLKL